MYIFCSEPLYTSKHSQSAQTEDAQDFSEFSLVPNVINMI